MSAGIRRVTTAWAVASLGSGLPSTLCSLVAKGDLLAATRAAGTLVPGWRHRPNVAGGVVAHAGISTFWTAIFVVIGRRRRWSWSSGAVAGSVIAALDLGLVGRRYPHIAALPRRPQWLDHLAFGALLGGMLGRPVRREAARGAAAREDVEDRAGAGARRQVPAIP